MTDAAERFTRTYRRHRLDIERYVLRRAPELDVPDVVADVFTVAWRRLDEVGDESPLPWLYGVARRVLANEFRGRGRAQRLVQRAAATAVESVEDHSDAVVQRLAFLTALDQLREQDREAARGGESCRRVRHRMRLGRVKLT